MTLDEKQTASLLSDLVELQEYFDNFADAEYFPDSPSPKPNQEMALLVLVEDMIRIIEATK